MQLKFLNLDLSPSFVPPLPHGCMDSKLAKKQVIPDAPDSHFVARRAVHFEKEVATHYKESV